MRPRGMRPDVAAVAAVLLAPSLVAPTDLDATAFVETARLVVRVHARNAMVREALTAAARDAVGRLAAPGCARVFRDFRDASGLTLHRRLESLGASGEPHTIFLYDGASRRACRSPRTLAFTETDSRVVYVCPRFVLRQRLDPVEAPVVIIHELLHTLGLPETSVTSAAITRQVQDRCGA